MSLAAAKARQGFIARHATPLMSVVATFKTSMSRPFGVLALAGSDRLKAGLQTRGVPMDRFIGPNAWHQSRGAFPRPVVLPVFKSSAHQEFDSIRRSLSVQDAPSRTCNTFSMRLHFSSKSPFRNISVTCSQSEHINR